MSFNASWADGNDFEEEEGKKPYEGFNASWADGNDSTASRPAIFGICFNASWADGNDTKKKKNGRLVVSFNASWADGNDHPPLSFYLSYRKFQCLVGGRERLGKGSPRYYPDFVSMPRGRTGTTSSTREGHHSRVVSMPRGRTGTTNI